MIIKIKIILPLLFITALFLSFSGNAINVSVKLESTKGLPSGNIAVYLTPTNTSTPLPTRSTTIDINQQDRAFYPQINIMRKNNNINFINKDDITHQIYSPIGDNKFSFKIRAGESYTQPNLSTLGEVTMGCNIHDWMSGYLLVVDTPYYGVTNEKGTVNFNITHKGEYKITLWHPLFKNKAQRIMRVENIIQDTEIVLTVKNKKITLPVQEPTGNFDFLSDY